MSRDEEEPVPLDYDSIEHETDGAILFKMGDDKHWIPRSVIEEVDPEESSVTVAYWWAYKNDMI